MNSEKKYFTKGWSEGHTHEVRPDVIYNQHLPYKTDGFFIEIGTGGTMPPATASNTGDFADMGWHGAYFDPHSGYCEEAKIRHKKNLSRIKVLNYGVGDKEEVLQLYPGDTLREDVNAHYDSLGWLDSCKVHGSNYKKNYGTHFAKIITPNQALEMAECPLSYDVLSVDVEGYELKIISNYNFNRYRPKLVVIELRVDNRAFPEPFQHEGREVVKIMLKNGYKVIHKDCANQWFLDTHAPPTLPVA